MAIIISRIDQKTGTSLQDGTDSKDVRPDLAENPEIVRTLDQIFGRLETGRYSGGKNTLENGRSEKGQAASEKGRSEKGQNTSEQKISEKRQNTSKRDIFRNKKIQESAE